MDALTTPKDKENIREKPFLPSCGGVIYRDLGIASDIPALPSSAEVCPYYADEHGTNTTGQRAGTVPAGPARRPVVQVKHGAAAANNIGGQGGNCAFDVKRILGESGSSTGGA